MSEGESTYNWILLLGDCVAIANIDVCLYLTRRMCRTEQAADVSMRRRRSSKILCASFLVKGKVEEGMFQANRNPANM